MRIALASSREPKIEAIREAWALFGSRIIDDPRETIQFLHYDVPATSHHMPLSAQELMRGAQERVESLTLQLKKEKAEADFYVGLEGGFNIISLQGPRRQVFLESWAYVSDGHRGYFGHGGGIYVPSALADPVVDRGIELGIVIDRFSRQSNVRSMQGTWGVLTDDLITRKHSFVIALIAAFAPFYNPQAYD
ncbi:MAG: DUF84 family protein [Acidobacteria bacterium]|nr:DUF84 family protein [Acidobacteriota bacterium]